MSIFNPTERWVQVGIAVSGLSIDGEKVSAVFSPSFCVWFPSERAVGDAGGAPNAGRRASHPVADCEEQDYHRAQEHRGAEGAVHPTPGRSLQMRYQRVVLACLCSGRCRNAGGGLCQEGGPCCCS